MVELARAFYKSRVELRRGLVVAWWPGHSNARYGGSTWFADRYYNELRTRAVAYVNVDGIGQVGAKRFGASTTSSLAALVTEVVKNRVGVDIQPERPGRNSDQSFNGVGLPLLQINHSRIAEDGGYWWWHRPEDTLDKIDFQILKTDTDLYADALSVLLSAPVLPVDLVAEVEALGEMLGRLQVGAEDFLDFSEVIRCQQRLLESVCEINEVLGRDSGIELDVALVRILRPLHRVLYVPLSSHHPDSGAISELLPGFVPLQILTDESPESDRYQFALTSLTRERNRLLEALDVATEEARRLLTTLP